MEGTDALLAGVGLEVPHDHLFDEQPRGSGSPLRRTQTVRHQLVLRFQPHLRFQKRLGFPVPREMEFGYSKIRLNEKPLHFDGFFSTLPI